MRLNSVPHRLRPHLGGGIFAEGDPRQPRRQPGQQLAAVRVVEIDDGDAGERAGAAGKEAGLHLKIGVERFVIVEMVAGEIGEDHRVETHAEHALLVDAVRAHLHDRLPAAGVAHLGEHAENVEWLGVVLVRGHRARPEVVIDRADEADVLVECRPRTRYLRKKL